MTSVRLEEIEKALSQANCNNKTTGNRIQAQCPAHDDNVESLSVTKVDDGKILLNCHAGCETKEVVEALGLTFQDLFPQDLDNSSNNTGNTITYDYRDANGKLLFQAVRKPGKQFRQRQPKAGGGWQWNLKGIDPIIYNLPAVIDYQKQNKSIFIVEGEKDAQALIDRGLCATTAPMGAGKWKGSFNKYFEGSEIVILPDNDRAGKEHAIQVTKELLPVAKSLRLLQLPNVKAKGDVSDWLNSGGTAENLSQLAFNRHPILSVDEAEFYLDLETNGDYKDKFYADDLKIYDSSDKEQVIADFNIEIKSIVQDDRAGRIFYIQISEFDKGRKRVSQPIEIHPECLDNKRSFYKAIRPYSMGEIKNTTKETIQPLHIFKWLLDNYDKPAVRRPDHLGFIKGAKQRLFWIFGNAVVCPPWKGNPGKTIPANDSGEFIINEKEGFTLPLYESEAEKEQITPTVDTDLENVEQFLGEIKTKLLHLIGGGDPKGQAKNYGKLLLAYVIYHLYEDTLYTANDMNGHTVLFYVFGPKGTGKTTYFNTILRAFFGLQKTKSIKGNSVSVSGLETMMSMYSQMPVCYDEFNPELSKISYQHINAYYHKSSRSVSDMDRKNRNKFINIRSSFCITSNFPINLSVDQADTTQSRAIYFRYLKKYRSDDRETFEWMQDNLHRLSSITVHLLNKQTDEKRKKVKKEAVNLCSLYKDRLEAKFEDQAEQHDVEHRLVDNYTRLLACYELEFGEDTALRKFIEDELIRRFADAKENNVEHKLINQIIFLASSGKLKEAWQYNYNNNHKELYLNLNQCFSLYENHYRDQSLTKKLFKEVLQDYFERCGGYDTATKRWTGRYFDEDHQPVDVSTPQHSYILTYEQIIAVDNKLNQMFRPGDKHQQVLNRMTEDKDNDEEVPF